MNSTSFLNKEFEAIRKDLIIRYNELGMRASGDFEKAEVLIDEKQTKLSASILGQKYTEQLVYGRANGKMPPVQAIEKWIVEKGLTPIEKGLTVSSLAFLIARKIAKEGTRYFRQGGTDLISSVVTPERLDKIINQVGVINVNKTVTTITNYLKSIEA